VSERGGGAVGEHEAFHLAILDDYDNDAPRLVYADWLDEHGHPAMAEFIRLGCEFARQIAEVGQSRATDDLWQRSQRLFRAHRAEWLGPLNQPKSRLMRFSLHDRGAAIFLARCTTKSFVARFGAWTHDIRLPHEFHAVLRMGLRTKQRIADWPRLDFLTSLHLRDVFDSRDMAELAERSDLARLHSLQVDNWRVNKFGMEALAGSAYLTRLKRLSIRNPFVGIAEFLTKLGPANLPALEWLIFSAGMVADPANERPLADSPALQRLHLLSVRSPTFGDAGASWVAASPFFNRLEGLELIGCNIGPKGMEALATSPHFGRLRDLCLCGNRIGDDGLRALVASPLFGSLRDVNLCSCWLGPADAKLLLEASALPRSIDLRGNISIDWETRQRLRESDRCRFVLES
jgi:uncharacterized protein (TIGR02996 family)